jgi:hypothetical protein
MIDEQIQLRDGRKVGVVPELGHFSIMGKVLEELAALPR